MNDRGRWFHFCFPPPSQSNEYPAFVKPLSTAVIDVCGLDYICESLTNLTALDDGFSIPLPFAQLQGPVQDSSELWRKRGFDFS
jgi:hypothetical protein